MFPFLSSYPSSVFLFFKSMYLAYHQRALMYGISLMSIHPLTNNFSLWGSLQVGLSVRYCKQGSGGTVLTQTLCTRCCRVGAEHTCGLISLWLPGCSKEEGKPRKRKPWIFVRFQHERQLWVPVSVFHLAWLRRGLFVPFLLLSGLPSPYKSTSMTHACTVSGFHGGAGWWGFIPCSSSFCSKWFYPLGHLPHSRKPSLSCTLNSF